jgi:23S rRNA pseudouridine1911/1915/1917 synthase
MERVIEWRVTEGGERVDKYLAARLPELSRSQLQRLIQAELVTVNGAPTKASYRVAPGDAIVARVPPPEPTSLVAEPIPLDIVYEDADLVVVNKPAGMVVHPAYGHVAGTVINAILARCPELTSETGSTRPGVVHRLDKDTSGLLVVAKNDAALRDLQGQFKGREVKKVYLALVEGRLTPERGLIDAAVGRDPLRRQRMAVVKRGGREARTQYRVLEYFAEYTLVEAQPLTGRTHQIRVHFASVGHPVVGDPVYGFRQQRLGLARQFLHAHTLGFRLPGSHQYVEFTADLPGELKEVVARLRN